MSIIYKSKRIGQNEKLFTIYKFRTMIESAETLGGSSTPANDRRLTRIGKFLKKWHLDELPQIYNIIKRDMNFIGPRPDVPEYINKMTKKEKEIILSVRPGITDLASIWDFDEPAILRDKENPDEHYEKYIWPIKKKLQIYYVENRTLWLDMKIIWWTFLRVLGFKKDINKRINKIIKNL